LKCLELVYKKFESEFQDKEALREGIKTLIIKKICYGHDEEDL
jgi:hypothetical protein